MSRARPHDEAVPVLLRCCVPDEEERMEEEVRGHPATPERHKARLPATGLVMSIP